MMNGAKLSAIEGTLISGRCIGKDMEKLEFTITFDGYHHNKKSFVILVNRLETTIQSDTQGETMTLRQHLYPLNSGEPAAKFVFFVKW